MEAKIYEHPLRDGRFVVIVHGTPLHFVGILSQCKRMKKLWDKKLKDYGKVC